MLLQQGAGRNDVRKVVNSGQSVLFRMFPESAFHSVYERMAANDGLGLWAQRLECCGRQTFV